MSDPQRRKDPTRVRTGRLGALSVHARGRTNTVPAHAAWLANVAAAAGITNDLEPEERARRQGFAVRERMARLATARWVKAKHAAPSTPAARGER